MRNVCLPSELRLLPCLLFLASVAGCSSESRAAGARTASAVDWSQPSLVVEPQTTRAIQGVSELVRKRYFGLCDPGKGFEQRVKDDAMYEDLVRNLGVAFGRELGTVKAVSHLIKERADRPGYADLTALQQRQHPPVSERMRADFGANLDVAAHGKHNAFPEFMGRFDTKESRAGTHAEYFPRNIEAAAELSAAVLKYNYTDFDRPRFYEPVNEPHWSFFKLQPFADWHLKTMQAVHAATPEVKVGGLCMSVSYFFRDNYRAFDGLKDFMDNTGGRLDFYSFHVYDYLRWTNGEYRGRIQSGLALENTLDLVPNYAINAFGKEVAMVISEHGGYDGSQPKGEFDGESAAEEIARRHFPHVTGFEREMKKRSIVALNHVSSIIANTLSFMDHPHTVQKAVLFLLFNTWSWNPKYYASLYVPYDYTDNSRWVETPLMDFYRLFQGVSGRRVKALCTDPDLQARAFVSGSKLYLAVNNLSARPETVALHGIAPTQVELRRFGRNPDFTSSFSKQTLPTPERLELAGREAVVVVADLGAPVKQAQAVDEVVCYGDAVTRPGSNAVFKVKVPVTKPIDYAILRIGLTRPPDRSRSPTVTLNGQSLVTPLEDSAERFTDREYASTKCIALEPNALKAENVVVVSFPDGTEGVVGSVVIRAAVAN
ncbi:MAG: beta-agarase [Verrucomicrobia bacterium]|nr:beta-agarase [Verrucomicrobiota bacterium]